ncbi:endolytic transglycosylase MltG [Candidatus Gracilibacteria bacterium]|nr:endolytic transglycosylase MltG [Candidatus Gracilibacteria bacterium]
MKSKSKPKIGRRILLIIIIFLGYRFLFGSITLDSKVTVQAGDNFQIFADSLSKSEQFRIKFYLFFNQDEVNLSKIQVGNYYFSGSYSPSSFLSIVQAGPQTNYSRYTVLEGRSIYDIDADLTKKGFIQAGEYIAFVTDSTYISKYITRYDFLAQAGYISSLEGFLYPDTYNIDVEKGYIDQLVYLQLQAFKNKVRNKIYNQLGFFPYDFYKLISLASVVEKEERNPNNKTTVAGILLNRIKVGMRIDADITLCYGYQMPYESCTPSFIASKISDSNNPYNTRGNAKFVPQPISNPSFDTIDATLNYTDTDYMFYLHDSSGNIHYGKTLDQHNQNKRNYL